IQGGKSLAASSIFQLHGVRVMCYWEGSEAACTTCKSKGHWAQNCTPRDRKAAERRDKLDPAPPIKQAKTPEKNKGKEKEDKQASENEETDKAQDELSTLIDTYMEEISTLPPAEIPPAKNPSTNPTKKVIAQLSRPMSTQVLLLRMLKSQQQNPMVLISKKLNPKSSAKGKERRMLNL